VLMPDLEQAQELESALVPEPEPERTSEGKDRPAKVESAGRMRGCLSKSAQRLASFSVSEKAMITARLGQSLAQVQDCRRQKPREE
jgi:hypothetical protein